MALASVRRRIANRETGNLHLLRAEQRRLLHQILANPPSSRNQP